MKINPGYKRPVLWFGALLFILVGLNVGFTLPGDTASDQNMPWIQVKGSALVRNGQPFKFIGANAVNLVFYDNWELDVNKAIRQARENNLSVLRLYLDWGWSKNEDFDRIIDMAHRNGIYLVLVLTDCCCSSDYANVNKYFEVYAPFCNVENQKSRDAFKKRIRQIIERKNTVNGRIYRDEPAILAWEVANELEYWHFLPAQVRNWVKDIAGFVKSLDRKHLVTVSFGGDGSDFDHASLRDAVFTIKELDFLSFHFYPAVSMSEKGTITVEDDYAQRIKLRAKNFIALGKPVIMGEFGFSNSAELNSKCKTEETSSRLYIEVYQRSMDMAFLSGASGVLFWGWGVSEEKGIPMWWSRETHSPADKKFCDFIKGYKIPLR